MSDDLIELIGRLHIRTENSDWMLMEEAADCIEAMADEISHLRATLEVFKANPTPREQQLEAALREIDKLYPVEQFGYSTGFKAREIARRALEKKKP